MIAYILVAAALTAPVVWWLTRSKAGPLERELVAACRNDGAQAGRLLEHEQRRRSGLTREQAAKRALVALRRDL